MHARFPATLRRLRRASALAAAIFLGASGASRAAQNGAPTTPIRHLVVIFQENVSFDHYFGTYPNAANPPGEPAFLPVPGTPVPNGLTPALLNANPNSSNPFRLDRSQAATCDQGHDYTPEQQAVHAGLMDRFVEFTGAGTGCDPAQVMGYFDGNTVTALWNYAQAFAMSDNSFGTTFGPSTPGALNLVAGQTHGVNAFNQPVSPGDVVASSVIGDPQPFYDECSSRETVGLAGKNVGDLLNAKGISWGWFQGGFRPTGTNANGQAVCGATHMGSNGQPKGDYIPHHEPFQYYATTANPHHVSPGSLSMIGQTDQANHQYDLADFWSLVSVLQGSSDDDGAAGAALPAVTFLKASGYQDGHAGYSDPLAEQTFLVNTINTLQGTPEWKHMAIIIAWDDSDGWYDHVMAPIVSRSNTAADALTGPSIPGAAPSGDCGAPAAGSYLGRCGYGPRLPLIVISPYAKKNFIDHGISDQSSILRFIEDNWSLPRIGDQSFDEKAGSLLGLFDFCDDHDHQHNHRLLLDPTTGQPGQGDGGEQD